MAGAGGSGAGDSGAESSRMQLGKSVMVTSQPGGCRLWAPAAAHERSLLQAAAAPHAQLRCHMRLHGIPALRMQAAQSRARAALLPYSWP